MEDDDDLAAQAAFFKAKQEKKVEEAAQVRRAVPSASVVASVPMVVPLVVNDDVMASCDPPQKQNNEAFPKAVRREERTKKMSRFESNKRQQQQQESVSAPSVGHHVGSVSTDPLLDEIARENEEKISQMSPQEIQEAQQEIMSFFSSKALAFLAKRSQQKQPKEEEKQKPEEKKVIVSSASSGDVSSSSWKQMVLPSIESDKLAWTDPNAVQKPREKEADFSRSLRVQAFRFGLDGEILHENAASEETYNAGLHHHGEDPDRAGYTLDELMLLMRSQNDQQNVFAVTIVFRIVKNVLQGTMFQELLYPENSSRSMTVGEAIIWEILAMRMLVAVRICIATKKAPSVRQACWSLIRAFAEAFADEKGLVAHDRVSYWGVPVMPSAPLFEDDGSEEMERLDGLRMMVRQLDCFYLFAPMQSEEALDCLIFVAGHSAALSMELGSQSGFLESVAARFVMSDQAEHPHKGLKLLRRMLSSDRRFAVQLESTGVNAAVWRHVLAPLNQEVRWEAALLLRVLLVYGLQWRSFVAVLPELLKQVSVVGTDIICMLATASLPVVAQDRGLVDVVAASLPLLVAECKTSLAPVLHFCASLLYCVPSLSVEEVIAPVVARVPISSDFDAVFGLMRLANVCSNIKRLVPEMFWSSEMLDKFVLSAPEPKSDKSNRFRTQRRTRRLVAERCTILALRELLIACVDNFSDPIRVFGVAYDLVARLSLVGVDEPLCLEFCEKVLFNANLIERVAHALHGSSNGYDKEDSLRQSKLMCQGCLDGFKDALFFGQTDWLDRCRVVAGVSKVHHPIDHLFASRQQYCLGTFVGSDWVFSLLQCEDIGIVRASLQMLFLAEACQHPPKSLSILGPVTKLTKVCRFFTSAGQNAFRDGVVASALSSLLNRFGKQIKNESFVVEDVDEIENTNPMQTATDLVESFLSHGSESSVFALYVFFFMRADIPFDFRILCWSSLASSWKMLRLDLKSLDVSSHLFPLEQNKKVLTLMEDTLKNRGLTMETNSVVYWLAVHHLSGWVFESDEPEWNRLQLLKRLKETQPSVFDHVVRYEYHHATTFPPQALSDNVKTDRSAFVGKLLNFI